MRWLVVVAACWVASVASAMPVVGLAHLHWGMSRMEVRKAVPHGKLARTGDSGSAFVTATMPIEGVARWVEFHFDARGLYRIYVSLGGDAGESARLSASFSRKLVAAPPLPARYPLWTDASSEVYLSNSAGCHAAHHALLLHRRVPVVRPR
jgi:hypothetical protein